MFDSAMPWAAACQGPLSSTDFQSLLKFMSIESVMLSNHLIFCHPILLLPSYLGNKTINYALINLRRLKLYQASFPNHDSMKLKINYEVKTGKYTNMWRLKFTDNHWVKELKDKVFLGLRWIKIKIQHTKTYGIQKKAILRGKFIVINAFIKK